MANDIRKYIKIGSIETVRGEAINKISFIDSEQILLFPLFFNVLIHIQGT